MPPGPQARLSPVSRSTHKSATTHSHRIKCSGFGELSPDCCVSVACQVILRWGYCGVLTARTQRVVRSRESIAYHRTTRCRNRSRALPDRCRSDQAIAITMGLPVHKKQTLLSSCGLLCLLCAHLATSKAVTARHEVIINGSKKFCRQPEIRHTSRLPRHIPLSPLVLQPVCIHRFEATCTHGSTTHIGCRTVGPQ
jgi:hypothetical protein